MSALPGEQPRWRWHIYRFLVKLPSVCPANVYSRVFYKRGKNEDRHRIRVDSICRGDTERNGSCWCGKLQEEARGD